MGLLLAAMRMQLHLTRRSPAFLMVLFTVPPETILYLALVRDAGREDLTGHALMAAVLIGVWSLAIWVSGNIVTGDRWQGTLELSVAAPGSYAVVLLGRVLAVSLVSLLAFGEVWLTAWIAFGETISVPHPGVFTATLLVSVVAMAATALVMATLFVLSRVANTFQNAFSYPFYVVAGVMVPIALLPGWVEPLSKLVFLTWTADLLRASLGPPAPDGVLGGLVAIAGLGVAGFLLGAWLLGRVTRRVRRTGEISQA